MHALENWVRRGKKRLRLYRHASFIGGLFDLLLALGLVGSGGIGLRASVGLEIELDEEEEVGEDDGERNHVGPHDLPRTASLADGDVDLEVHVG